MAWIKKEDWLNDKYARALNTTNVYQLPSPANPETNQLQTQIENDEVVQILGEDSNFYLIKKFEGTLGWISKSGCTAIEVGDVNYRFNESCSIDSFFKKWQGTPYLWGGVTRQGIDCSGFVQRYFLEVHSRIIPKNSRDQRKLGIGICPVEFKNSDLIFTTTKSGNHHVGVFHQDYIWHATDSVGVCAVPVNTFLKNYKSEECKRILQTGGELS